MENVFKISYKIFLLNEVKQEEALIKIASCIDRTLLKDEKWSKLHMENCFKPYCFSAFYPLAQNGKYKKNQVYQITIRTVNLELAQYLIQNLPKYDDNVMKGLICEGNILRRSYISALYSLTPVIVKGKNGKYWRDDMTFLEFEEQLRVNLIKKYRTFWGEESINESLFTDYIEIKNRVPIKIPYKNIYLLGDKLYMRISEHPDAQKLAYLALGTGLGNMNTRGMGAVNAEFQ